MTTTIEGEVIRNAIYGPILSRVIGGADQVSDDFDARNNLAVAYELQGKITLATAEYERALAVEAVNVYIEQNYQLHQQAMIVKRRKEEHNKTFETSSRR